jgi:arylformamidase
MEQRQVLFSIMIFLFITSLAVPVGFVQASNHQFIDDPAIEIYYNISYTEIPGVDPSLLSLDVYTKQGWTQRPVLIYVHGGGWTIGDKSHVGYKAEAALDNGFVFISTNYRLTDNDTQFPAHVQDVASAIKWTYDTIQLYGGDPEYICLLGHSAGAHLVALVATDEAYLLQHGLDLSILSAVVPLDTRAYNLSLLAIQSGGAVPDALTYTFTDDPDFWIFASPSTYVTPGKSIPSMLVAYSGGSLPFFSSTRREQATIFVDKLTDSGVNATLLPAAYKTHNGINKDLGKPGGLVTKKVFDFLKEQVDLSKTRSTQISYEFIKKEGYRVSWSTATDHIVFDMKQDDGYFDIYTMMPDGSQETCLTDNSLYSSGHKGCAAWHPSGDYIVFTSQKEQYFGKHIPFLKQGLDKLAIPGEGLNCDLYLMTADGKHCWQLSDLPTKMHFLDKQPYTGVLHPHFSHDGTKLLWSERIDSADTKWGEWILNIADFTIQNKTPVLENITVYKPGNAPCFYESHGFSTDDSKIIFSGNLKQGQDENHLDIYTFDLTTHELVCLTTRENEWDEHAHYAPDGQKILWMTSSGYGMNTEKNWRDYLRTEYWLMNPDGTGKTQLTFYNENNPGQRIVCSDADWSPDGKKIATTMLIFTDTTIVDGGIAILSITK